MVARTGVWMARSHSGNDFRTDWCRSAQGRMVGRSGGCAHSILFLPAVDPSVLVGRISSYPSADSSQSTVTGVQTNRLGIGASARRDGQRAFNYRKDAGASLALDLLEPTTGLLGRGSRDRRVAWPVFT